MTREILRFARFCFRVTQGQAVLALLFLLLGTLTEGISILLLIPLLQLVGPAGSSTANSGTVPIVGDILGPNMRFELGPLLIGFVALVTAQALFNRYKSIYMADVMQTAVDRLRNSLFASIGAASWRFIVGSRGSDLNHALTADVDRVNGAIFNLILLIQNIVILVIFGAISLMVSPAMTLFAVVVGGVVLALLYPVRSNAVTFGDTLTQARQEQYRTVSEFITGMKLAKAFNAEPVYLNQMAATLRSVRAGNLRYVRLSANGTLLFQVASTIAVAAFIYVAFARLHMPLTRIVVMVFLFMRVAPRFNAVQDSLQQLLVNMPAFTAMQALMKACRQQRDAAGEGMEPLPPLADAIRFEDVTLRFGDADPVTVLRNVGFAIPARRITALIGPSGSGKSTLADLVMGLLEPSEGRVTVDGAPLGAANRRDWRDQIAYVPQDVFLLHDSIAANLAMARTSATRGEMWAALEAAHAAEFVRRLPAGIDSVVGDRGMRLSGGERQRIALARGLLRHPQLLILDEATSALDWQNQQLIAQSIEALRGTMTIITIAHRPSMIAFADWVVTIEDGEVVETGAYADLLSQPGSRLHHLVSSEQGRERDPDMPGNQIQ